MSHLCLKKIGFGVLFIGLILGGITSFLLQLDKVSIENLEIAEEAYDQILNNAGIERDEFKYRNFSHKTVCECVEVPDEEKKTIIDSVSGIFHHKNVVSMEFSEGKQKFNLTISYED